MRSPIALCVGLAVAALAAGTAVGSGDRAVGTLELDNALVSSYYKFDRAYCPAGVRHLPTASASPAREQFAASVS